MSVLCNPLRVQKKTSERFSFPGLKQWTAGSCGAKWWDAQPKGVLRAYLWPVRGVMAGPLQGFSIVRRMRKPEYRSKTMWTYVNGGHHKSTAHQHQLEGCFPTSMLYSCKGTFKCLLCAPCIPAPDNGRTTRRRGRRQQQPAHRWSLAGN